MNTHCERTLQSLLQNKRAKLQVLFASLRIEASSQRRPARFFKTVMGATLAIVLFAFSGFCDKEVAFIGLTGAQAPAIEKTFNRHFLEDLAMIPGVHSLNTIEIANLRERTSSDFDIVSMTPALFASLKRFASDSTLVIWGRVKECSIRPERFWVIGAGIRGTLAIELTIYDLAGGKFIYIGDVKASTLEKKGIVLWWSVERALQISAQERTQILDDIELKGVYASGRILSTLMLNETSQKSQKGKWPSDSAKKTQKSNLNKNPPNEEPPVIDEEPADFGSTDSTVDSTKQK
jgi:hypothetical protein